MTAEANIRDIAAQAGAPPREAVAHGRWSRRRRRFLSLTNRILAINVLALIILVASVLYLDLYRQSLIDAEIESLRIQGELFAAALGEGAVRTGPGEGQELLPEAARQMVRRLAEPARVRGRLFNIHGDLIADSRVLMGPGGLVQIEELPPPQATHWFAPVADRLYGWLIDWMPRRGEMPLYEERARQYASDYPEVMRALGGETVATVWRSRDDGLVFTVAVPVQRLKQIQGVLLISAGSAEIEQTVRRLQFNILQIFAVALAITVLLSLYLASTIASPVRRLADAAERVRRGHGRHYVIPDFTARGDEIGELSGALREMTSALWQRIDAIERFAADVAHEIKNPLSSLRSAVETASRIQDPTQQRRLMTIILEDVQRLDRLISDISDASRLEAELSRAEAEPVDVRSMLEAMVELHESSRAPDDPQLVLEPDQAVPLVVSGIDSRLAQVFRNVISNAISFSPPDGVITLRAGAADSMVEVRIEDQGPGIPEDKLEAIFERFYTERPPSEKFGTHSGLGLSISRQIVDSHGGTIEASNIRDAAGRAAGACFTVRLPQR